MKAENFKMQIHGHNELNRVSFELAKQYVQQLGQFLNKKINIQNGFAKKFKDTIKRPEIKPVPFNYGFSSLHTNYLEVKWGELFLNVSICLNGGKHDDRTYYCEYFNKTVHLGKLDDKSENLIRVFDIEQANDFSVISWSEEIAKIETYKVLLEQAEKAKDKIKVPAEWYKYL